MDRPGQGLPEDPRPYVVSVVWHEDDDSVEVDMTDGMPAVMAYGLLRLAAATVLVDGLPDLDDDDDLA